MTNPHNYEAGFSIENHRDELISRLSKAIKRINALEDLLRRMKRSIEALPWILRRPQLDSMLKMINEVLEPK